MECKEYDFTNVRKPLSYEQNTHHQSHAYTTTTTKTEWKKKKKKNTLALRLWNCFKYYYTVLLLMLFFFFRLVIFMHDIYERYVYHQCRLFVLCVHAHLYLWKRQHLNNKQKLYILLYYCVWMCVPQYLWRNKKPKIFNWPISRDFVHHSLRVLVFIIRYTYICTSDGTTASNSKQIYLQIQLRMAN